MSVGLGERSVSALRPVSIEHEASRQVTQRERLMKLFEPQGLLIILIIVLVIFGPKQLPQLGKTLGQTMRSIREGIEDSTSESPRTDAEADSARKG